MPGRIGTLALLLPALAVLLLTGCAEAGRPAYAVEGKVVFPDGQPLTEGVVEFETVEDIKTRINARGEIQPDGTFRLTTYVDNDGAVAGEHRALVMPPLPLAGPAPPLPIKARYRSYETSGLTFTVKPETQPLHHSGRKALIRSARKLSLGPNVPPLAHAKCVLCADHGGWIYDHMAFMRLCAEPERTAGWPRLPTRCQPRTGTPASLPSKRTSGSAYRHGSGAAGKDITSEDDPIRASPLRRVHKSVCRRLSAERSPNWIHAFRSCSCPTASPRSMCG